MKGFNEYKIGDTFTDVQNRIVLTIRDYTIKTFHNIQHDRRTKKVETVVWSLFDECDIEFRKTSENITESIKSGLLRRQ